MLHPLLSSLVLIALVLVGLLTGGTVVYLLTLLIAAAGAARGISHENAPVALPETRKLLVVVPAHNERDVIVSTLRSLSAQEYPADRREIVVVADNCSDETAELARGEGATVLERTNTEQRGKGYALEWAFALLLARTEKADGYVVVDADTFVEPDFLSKVGRALFSGKSPALQGRYGVLNTRDSWRASLMTAAFDLVNHVKPLGRDRLGWGVGLKGNGMAFTRDVVERAPWQGSSITEDIDFGLDLLLHHGIAVGYLPDAVVRAQMPVSAEQAGSQRERWENGRYRLLRERAFPLFAAGVTKRDFRLVATAMDMVAPPLAELVVLHLVWLALAAGGLLLHLLPGSAWLYLAPPLLSLVCLMVYVVGGLKVAGAPREAFTALLRAPLYIGWKLALYALGMAKSKTKKDEWVRTERIAIVTEVEPPKP